MELPAETEGGPGMCGKLNFWLYVFRPAASACKDRCSEKLEQAGLVRADACIVSFCQTDKDLSLAAHGDDFTFCGAGEELRWIAHHMQEWYEIKVGATLGPDDKDDREVVILGRTVRWCHWNIS